MIKSNFMIPALTSILLLSQTSLSFATPLKPNQSVMTPEKVHSQMIKCMGKFKAIGEAEEKKRILKKKKQTALKLYMTAKEAYAFLQKDKTALLIDVRTPEETMFIGMPTVAAKNIPFMFVDRSKFNKKKNRYAMKRNPNFIAEADKFIKSKNLDEFSTVILMCRSGGRSSKAVNALAEAGYDNLYNVTDGFEGDKDKNKQRTVNGWKNSNLPWSYKIAPEKRYSSKLKVAQNTIK